MQKMMEDNNLIRVLAACETMGNATNICSDKTGTLTQNRMTVVEAWIEGEHFEQIPSSETFSAATIRHLSTGISVNTTATLLCDKSTSTTNYEVIGNKTDGALLLLLQDKFHLDYTPIREDGFQSGRGDQLITFTSKRKCMSVIQNFPSEMCLYTKGAAEVLLARCKKYINSRGVEVKLDNALRLELSESIKAMAKKSLRVLALAHNVASKKTRHTRSGDHITGMPNVNDLEGDLTLDALVGIKDPLRPDVKNAVETCQKAGIFVRMVTGDNLETAKAIAKECGILSQEGLSMEGPDFRQLTPKELDNILPKLQVILCLLLTCACPLLFHYPIH